MKSLPKSIVSATIVAMLLMSIAAVRPAFAVPSIYVDPALSSFSTDTKFVGDTFDVTIKVAEMTDMFAYEFRIQWDRTLIQLMSAVRPAGHFLEPIVDPANFFVPVWKLNESVALNMQIAHFGYTLLAPETGRTGDGSLVVLTFKILVAPGISDVMFTSVLDLFDTNLANTVPAPIPHTPIDGTYEYHWAPPSIFPYLSVNPASTLKPAGAPIVGTPDAFFDVYIDLNTAVKDWWMVGIEFKLAYDPALIDFVSASVDPWVDGFGDIFMVPVVEGVGTIHTGVVLLPHSFPPSVWNYPIYTSPPDFPGPAHLLKLTFEVIYQEAMPWIGTSPLDLYDVMFSDINANPIPPAPSVDGSVTVQGFVIGRNIDLYTQYPNPFGGQGPAAPSDSYAPQDEVILYAYVTYNLDPVQNKPVSFEVKWPDGTPLLTRTAFTDVAGIATINFRVPWPDLINPHDVFGTWRANATVDIANQVVTDFLTFVVDWMVEVTVEPIGAPFQKLKPANGEMVFKVTWTVNHAQPLDVLITVTVYDELSVPIAHDAIFGTYTAGTYDHTFTLLIPTWAYVGIGTVFANAFSWWPQNGGFMYGPEASASFTILAP